MDLGPDKRAGDIDRRVLPDPALGTAQAADVEAVELDQIAGQLSFEVALDRWERPLRLGRRRVAGNLRQPAQPSTQAMPAENSKDAARRDHHRLLERELGSQPAQIQARICQSHRQDLLLLPGWDLVGHPRRPSLPRPEHLQALSLDPALPAVEPGAVVAESPTGLAYPVLSCSSKDQQPMSVEKVIISHGGTSLWA